MAAENCRNKEAPYQELNTVRVKPRNLVVKDIASEINQECSNEGEQI